MNNPLTYVDLNGEFIVTALAVTAGLALAGASIGGGASIASDIGNGRDIIEGGAGFVTGVGMELFIDPHLEHLFDRPNATMGSNVLTFLGINRGGLREGIRQAGSTFIGDQLESLTNFGTSDSGDTCPAQ